jgi:hypothetical protein
MAQFRVIIQSVDTAAGRGLGSVVAIIDDAKDVGASEQVNGAGEFFMTLPQNHPHASAILPLRSHYRVQRSIDGGAYTTIFQGLIDDYESDPDEVVFYGRDYLSLLDTSITPSADSYSSDWVGDIIQAELSAGKAEPNSRFDFIGLGTIENTSTTTIALSSYQSRLEFIQQLADIAMADNAVRSVIQVSPRTSTTPSFNFTANKGSDLDSLRLEYGGNVFDYFYGPGYSTLRNVVQAIGQKREGATVLFSAKTSTLADAGTYGRIVEPMLFVDIVDQSALGDKTRRAVRVMARVGKTLGLALYSGSLGPWEGYDLADSVPVLIDNGIDNVDGLFTIWGVEWIGRRNGKEELVLSLQPKDA